MAELLAPAVERIHLDEASWVDVARGWLPDADAVYDRLVERTAWQESRVFRYDRWVVEPRVGSYWRPGYPVPDPVLVDLHRLIQRQYKVVFDGLALAWYRDGNDSVAFHRDRELRWLEDTVIGVLTLGARRPWLMRPRANRYDHAAPNKGATLDLAPASGDLLVMGGRCQSDWEHSVPKVPGLRAGRVSLQWRWTSRRGRQERGPSYRAARTYSR
jgi:alkylated DNA repair dioxygenase AlkB